MEIGKSNNISVEKIDTHHTHTTPASGAESTSTVTNMLIIGTLGKMWFAWPFTSVVFLPRTHYPKLIMRKHQKNVHLGTFYKLLNQYSSKLSKSLKTK